MREGWAGIWVLGGWGRVDGGLMVEGAGGSRLEVVDRG